MCAIQMPASVRYRAQLGPVVEAWGLSSKCLVSPTNVWVPKCQQVLSTRLPAPRQDPTKQQLRLPPNVAVFPSCLLACARHCNNPVQSSTDTRLVLSMSPIPFSDRGVGPDNIHCPLTQTTKYRTIVFGVSNFQGQGHAGGIQ